MKPGNPDKFPTRVRMPDGRALKGNQGSFPVEVTLPDGTILRGRMPAEEEQKEHDSNG